MHVPRAAGDGPGETTRYMTSDVIVRAAHPSTDRSVVLSLLDRNMPGAASGKRYDWLYLQNPVGSAQVWIAEDARTGRAVATSAALPKRIRIGGEVHTALNLTDFVVDRGYRSLGPALKLFRRTLEPVLSGKYTFAYEHSIGSMPALYARLGIRSLADVVLLARPLLVTPVLEYLWGPRRHGTRMIGRGADRALVAVAGARRSTAPSLDIGPVSGGCGDEFSAFEAETARIGLVRGVHGSEYLNWRVYANPLARHDIVCARYRGALQGFLVFRRRSSAAIRIVHLATRDDPRIARELLDHVAAIGRAERVGLLTVTLLSDSADEGLFRRGGFYSVSRSRGRELLPALRRPVPKIHVYVGPAPPHVKQAVEDPRAWRLSQIDYEDDETLAEGALRV